VRYDKGRLLDALDHICHCESLARTCGAEKREVFLPSFDPADKVVDGLGLIPRHFEIRYDFKLIRAHMFAFYIKPHSIST